MKKALSLILALVLTVSCLSGISFAAVTETEQADSIAKVVTGSTAKYVSTVAEMVAAIDASGDSVVTLMQDIEHNAEISVPSVTLDLNNHKLTVSGANAFRINKAGTNNKVTTIKNGTIDGGKSAISWCAGGLIIDNTTLIARSGMAVQILNHSDSDSKAANYADVNVIKNSTLFSSTWYVLSFNSSNKDFSKVNLTIENSELVSNSKNSAIANGAVKQTGTYTLGKGVSIYTKAEAYSGTSAKDCTITPNLSGEVAAKDGTGTHSVTVDGTKYTGLTKWATEIATVANGSETVSVSSVAEMAAAISESGESVVTLTADVRNHDSVSFSNSITLNLNGHTWFQKTAGSAIDIKAPGTSNSVTSIYNGMILNMTGSVGIAARGALHLDKVVVYSLSTMPIGYYTATGTDEVNAKNLIENSTLIASRYYTFSFRTSDGQSNAMMKFENTNFVNLYNKNGGDDIFYNGNVNTTGAYVLGENVNMYVIRKEAVEKENADNTLLIGEVNKAETAAQYDEINEILAAVGGKLGYEDGKIAYTSGSNTAYANWAYTPDLYKWTNEDAEATLNGGYYATLEAALAAAEAGDVVTLLKDTALAADAETAGSVVVPAGITLDLGGKTLTAAAMVANGTLKDTGAAVEGKKTGLLKVAADMLTVGEATTQLALYDADAEGFRFFTAAVEALNHKADGENALKFGFRITFPEANAQASDLLAANVAVKCDLSWTGETGKTVTYSFEKAIVEKYANGIKTEPKFAFIFRVGGLNTLEAGDELTVAPQFTTLRDQTVAVAAMTYTVAAGN